MPSIEYNKMWSSIKYNYFKFKSPSRESPTTLTSLSLFKSTSVDFFFAYFLNTFDLCLWSTPRPIDSIVH